MSTVPEITIRRWAFWSAEEEDPQAWLEHWSDPAASNGGSVPRAADVPAMQRRRLSKLSKMAVQLALEVSDSSDIGYTIFGSRHGEVVRTHGMLVDMADGETLSPTQFSQSVHNTSSGLFAILTEDKGPATSIAAGAATFAACWTEAMAELAARPDHPVLLVCADEVLPDIYADTSEDRQCDQALALILEAADGDEGGIQLRCSDEPGEISSLDELPMGPRVLAWWLSGEAELVTAAEGDRYRWSRS